MRILVTNDDGIHATGLKTAEAIARTLSDDVWVVAPEADQSGVAHSISLNEPMRLRQASPHHYALKGTPTDCVIMAVRHLLADKKPDLIISGVNRGQNIAEDVLYSGTVAGAIEGTIMGIKSIALSQAYGLENRLKPPFKTAETLAPSLIKRLLAAGFPHGQTLLNINFPNVEPDAILGYKTTKQGWRNMNSLIGIDSRMDNRASPYYWLAFSRDKYDVEAGSDVEAIVQGYVSVTPIKINYTDEAEHARLSNLLK